MPRLGSKRLNRSRAGSRPLRILVPRPSPSGRHVPLAAACVRKPSGSDFAGHFARRSNYFNTLSFSDKLDQLGLLLPLHLLYGVSRPWQGLGDAALWPSRSSRTASRSSHLGSDPRVTWTYSTWHATEDKKKVVIVGCGAQGLNQGLNMRDSGCDVSYALRKDAIEKKRQSYVNATQNGFKAGGPGRSWAYEAGGHLRRAHPGSGPGLQPDAGQAAHRGGVCRDAHDEGGRLPLL